jgi:hypothetical protein
MDALTLTYEDEQGTHSLSGSSFVVATADEEALLWLEIDQKWDLVVEADETGLRNAAGEPIERSLTLRAEVDLVARIDDPERGTLDLRSRSFTLVNDGSMTLKAEERRLGECDAYLVYVHEEWRSTFAGPFRAPRLVIAPATYFYPEERHFTIGTRSRLSALAAC